MIRVAAFLFALGLSISAALADAPILGVRDGGTGISIANQIHTATYGSVCDGQHHYLSTITKYMGQNSNGWTLSQWQSQFPANALPNGANLAATDIDGLAISAAFSAARAALVPYTLKVDGSKCFATYSIDNTNSNLKNAVLDYSGTNIYSTATGQPVIDFTGLQFATIIEPYVTGDATREPYDGYLIGRKAAGTATGNILIVRPMSDGSFTHCAVDNVQTELVTMTRILINNFDANGGRAVCLDGINHFNVAAASIFLPPTQPVDTYQSFTQGVIRDGLAVCATCDAPVWMAGLHGWKLTNLYTNNNNPVDPLVTGKYGYILYETSDGPNAGIDISFSRSEGYAAARNALTSTFFVTGTWSTPNIHDLTYKNPSDWSLTSLFKTDVSGANGAVPITSASFTNANITVDGFSTNDVPTWIDNPTIWSGSGNVYLPFPSNWAMPTGPSVSGKIVGWSGRVCIAANCYNTNEAKLSLTTFSELVSDQVWEHQLSTNIPLGSQFAIADGWAAAANGVAAGKATAQDAADFAGGGASYSMQVTVNTAATVSSGDELSIRTVIPGPDLLQANWGKGNAGYIVADVWLWANFTGVASAFSTNGSGTRVLAHGVTLPDTPSTWKEYIFIVPPYTNPLGFATQPNTIGMKFGFAVDCSSDYWVAADQWITLSVGQPMACVSGQAHGLATQGNQIRVASARLYALPAIPYLPNYRPPTYNDLQLSATRLFQKSIPAGTAPDATNGYKNAGLNGAYTFTASANLTASFTASASGAVLTVASVESGMIYRGMQISGAGYAVGNRIKDQTSGTAGGAGIYALANGAGTIGSETVTGQLGTTRVPFQEPMATNLTQFPTVSLFSPLAVSANCWDMTANVDGGACWSSNVTNNDFTITVMGAVAGHTYAAHWTAAAPM